MKTIMIFGLKILFLFSVSSSYLARADVLLEDNFTVSASIIIDASIEDVYRVAANAVNDSIWRSEVYSIRADGEFEEGTHYVEDAKLGIHPHYFTTVELIEKKPPYSAIYQTVKENPYYLKSARLLKSLAPEKTIFSYRVDIEKGMIRSVMGFPFPVSVVKMGYQTRMRKYLKSLKRYMEPTLSQ